MKVVKQFTFDSCHFLPNYSGKCANMHGHTYKLEVGFSGKIDDTGMVIDFNDIKRLISNCVEQLDHRIINEVITNPTAENMVKWFYKKISSYLHGDTKVCMIRLWETPTSYAEENY